MTLQFIFISFIADRQFIYMVTYSTYSKPIVVVATDTASNQIHNYIAECSD